MLMIMSRTRRDEAESLEDARIWATDMAGAGPGSGAGHYEKIGMRQYETIGSMNQQVGLLKHQHVHGSINMSYCSPPVPPATPAMWTPCLLTRMWWPPPTRTAASS